MGSESEERSSAPRTERREAPPEHDDRPTELDQTMPAVGGESAPKASEPEASTERTARASVAVRKSGDDTLLSLPAPADDDEIGERSLRVIELERRIEQLEARLAVLETAGRGGQRWLIWIAFLLTLAVGWQVVQIVRG